MKRIKDEDLELLKIDLCGRLPYFVKGIVVVTATDTHRTDMNGFYEEVDIDANVELHGINMGNFEINVSGATGNSDFDDYIWESQDDVPWQIEDFKPYLRPLSSMTEEEKTELLELMCDGTDIQRIDFYVSHYLDYRGLIEKGLALPAPEGMYFQQKSDDELKKDVAKKLIDVLIYDNDYVNRMTPLDESRHYGNWIDYVAKKVTFPDNDKEWWDKEDRIDIFAVGDYDDKEDMIKNYPSLREVDTVLNEYYDYLNEEFKI